MKCDELKKYKANENFGNGLVYSILEVNQVLDENDAEIEDLLRQNRELCQALQVMYSKEEYDKQKYKRCLAMARWCRIHDEFTILESERIGLPQRAIFMEYRREAIWWDKWRKRWLELAKKFKEAK